MSVGMWCSMAFRDAEAMMGWLRAVGFQESAVYRDEQDPSTVVHAELRWPRGGGVMCSTFRDQPDWPVQPGTAAAYLVCDDCDEVFARSVSAGATVLREPEDQDYGGRAAAVLDPEGNAWSMGTYAGE
ncbi:VOC family protein [Ornithinimicrobium sufpigmenti]|uniref:VOC family protein n=1 Tax=Ornithinimicrobium sufpigmenti TaxID=2508882 RepID=UPI0010363A21|nr:MULTISPECIES: VOC family protein [unclassified Ornithinimicrobium]